MIIGVKEKLLTELKQTIFLYLLKQFIVCGHELRMNIFLNFIRLSKKAKEKKKR